MKQRTRALMHGLKSMRETHGHHPAGKRHKGGRKLLAEIYKRERKQHGPRKIRRELREQS